MSTTRMQQLEAMAALIKSTYKPLEIAQLIEMIRPAYDGAELTPEEFTALIQRLRHSGGGRPFSDKSIQTARLILVQGATHAEAARETGTNLGQIGQLMKRIRGFMLSSG